MEAIKQISSDPPFKYPLAKLYKIIIATLTLTLLFSSCGKREEVETKRSIIRPVKMMTVLSSGDFGKRQFPGQVRASRRVDLSFKVDGPLIELPVEEGKPIKKGQLVARIDPKDFESNLRSSEGRLVSADAALQLAKTEYDRVIRIQKEDPGAVSTFMVDRRRKGVDSAEADIQSLQAQVDAAKDQHSYTYLRAPFSGVIAKRYVDNYQKVRAKELIASLDDVSQLEILVDIPENLMAVIKAGNAHPVATFTSVPGREFDLSVKEFETRADPTTQTFRVVLVMSAPEGIRILPGMTATVSGKGVGATRQEEEQYIIPAIAVVGGEAGSSKVWIVDREKMTVHGRKVTTGALTGTDSIEIIDGLESGDTIAITGVNLLREGMQVRDLSEMEGYGQ
jgi:RND family efflux transporter MFP subunit